MKKLLFILAAIFTINAQAIMVDAKIRLPDEAWFLLSTFSSPTVLVLDKEIQIGSEESVAFLLTEADEEVTEKPVTNALAEQLEMSSDQVSDAVISLYDMDAEISVENIIKIKNGVTVQ